MDQNNNPNQTISDDMINNNLNEILKEIEDIDANYQEESNKAFDTIDKIEQKVGVISDEIDSSIDELDKVGREYEDSLDGLIVEEVGIIEEDLEEEE